MSPLSGDSVGAAEQLLMNGDPAAAAGTDNHPEDGGGAGAGAIDRLGKGEAVGIVCHPHRLAKLLHDIPAQIVAVEHQAVAVFNASALRIDSPGQADPQSERLRADRAHIGNQGQQLTHKGVIALFVGWPTQALDAFACGIQQYGLHFGAANIYSKM